MNAMHRYKLAALAAAVLTSGAAAQTPASPPTDPGWPRSFTNAGTTLTLYQPQIDSWQDHEKIKFRCALQIAPAGATAPDWGVVAVQADTQVSDDGTDVNMTNMSVAAVNFPGVAEKESAALKAVVLDMLPNKPVLEVSLQRVMAYMHDQPKPAAVQLNLNPPPIYYSDVPAILVIFMGQPQFKPVPNTALTWAVNTNWVILMDTGTSQYYLLDGKSWLTAPDALKGPWTAASQLPADFYLLPDNDQWRDVLAKLPGQPLNVVPRVVTSAEPAELIVTQGAPTYAGINGTSLMYVSNPDMPVFRDLTDSTYYYLVAGRWFSAPNLSGPWAAASASLPAEFARIPESSPMSFVLTSVPGTVEANDAILLAQVPHKATINISSTTVNVAYQGAPKFEPVQGTPMQYAVNTDYAVVNANGQYYCCYQGVWFAASAATGPWAVCTSVPSVIYTIPPSSPVYNCTYVKVYSSTPDTVVVGYTSGYSGSYVAATGAVMFGAGVAIGAVIANNDDWYGYHPCYYSYGCASYYHGGYGGYYGAGWAHYGPYGGAGYHAGYNTATGSYYRGGAAYGAGGARWGGQAYNPWTNTYAQHTGGTNGYKSWGSSYVQQGSSWAAAGHQSTARGGAGYAENSSGQWAEGAHSNVTNSSVARTSSGDVYAGHDGNVYKNTGSGWEKYGGDGSWNDVQRPSGDNAQARQQSGQAARGDAQSNWSGNNAQGRQNAAGGDRSSGVGGGGFGGSGGGGGWSHHDTQSGLNSDSWSRSHGNGGGGGGFHGFGGGGGGGYGGRGGGGFGGRGGGRR